MPVSWSDHAQDSARWESKHPEFVQWWRSSQIAIQTRRLNMTDCDELEASIDEQCSFDGTQVKEFTRKMKENGGDFTLSFWVKPTGANSLVRNFVGDPLFVPQVRMQDFKISCMHTNVYACAFACQLTYNSAHRYFSTAKLVHRKRMSGLVSTKQISTAARCAWIHRVTEGTFGPLKTFL